MPAVGRGAGARASGFDHTAQGAYAAAAGVARALGLDAERTAQRDRDRWHVAERAARDAHRRAVALEGAGLSGHGAGAVQAAFLAMRGVTGPREVFEGNKGFMDAIAGPFDIDWAREDLEAVRRTILKRFNAEIHSQSAIEALLALRAAARRRGADVERIELDTFQVAFDIIGGGEEGDKRAVATKEEADHSLPYLLAVALLDGQVLPEQYRPQRITADDVQALLRRVEVRPDPDAVASASPPSTAPGCDCGCATAACSSASSTTTRASTPGRWEGTPCAAKFDRLIAGRVNRRRRRQRSPRSVRRPRPAHPSST